MPKLRMNQAIAQALGDEMRADPDVFLMGEDVGAAGGVFKTSEGLLDEFGERRVRDTPISEMGFLGAAVGAASTGLRPVVEIMFMEFLGVALDQLTTQAAKFRYLSGGVLDVPLVVRGSVGAGLGFGCQHSQTLESWVCSSPGLKAAMPSGPQSAYDLLRAAIRDNDPVVVLEPRALYGRRDEVDTDAPPAQIGQAAVRRAGTHATVVATGQMVGVALDAADALAPQVDLEVIDMRWLVPWDRSAVADSVGRTGRLAVIEESPQLGSWGNEVAAFAASELHGGLDAPVLRINAPDVPVPFPAGLEEQWLPDSPYVQAQVGAWAAGGALPDPWWVAEGARA